MISDVAYITGYYGKLHLLTRGQLTYPSNSLFTKSTTICETIEFSLNVFTEFSEFSDKNICRYSKIVQTCYILC